MEGRQPDPSAPDEVVLLDNLAGALDLGVGSTLGLCLLTTEEFASFDTGFGPPDPAACGDLPDLTASELDGDSVNNDQTANQP